jgi:hypothetical protein
VQHYKARTNSPGLIFRLGRKRAGSEKIKSFREFYTFVGYQGNVLRYLRTASETTMKLRLPSDASFLAKMVLLFALIFMGNPENQQVLENYVKVFLHQDARTVSQFPAVKVVAPASMH